MKEPVPANLKNRPTKSPVVGRQSHDTCKHQFDRRFRDTDTARSWTEKPVAGNLKASGFDGVLFAKTCKASYCHIQQQPNSRLTLSLNLTASTGQQLDFTHLGVEFFATLLDALQLVSNLLECHHCTSLSQPG